MDSLLTVDGLSVQFNTKKGINTAVDGISFSVGKGEILGIVGESGCGKSVTSLSILRLLGTNARISQGSVKLEGRELLSLSEDEMCKIRGNEIAMIFQDPMTALNPIMTVGSQISEAIRLHNNITRAEADKQAIKMLEMVGIPGQRFGNYPLEFSGGMKQRVVIAMALACKPELLLADEPTTALDVTIQAQVLEMMRELQKTLNTSVILITHDLGIVAEMCEKVAIIYAGEIVEYGSAEDIFDHRQHPYTEGLFGSIPTLQTTAKRLSPIKGMMPDPANLPDCCKFAERCPYASDECRKAVPGMTEVSPGHTVRCVRARKEETT